MRDERTPQTPLAPAQPPAAGGRNASAGRRAALYGVLVALALVAGYVEMLVPVPLAVPGVKLGLGNIVVLFALARLGARPAFAVMAAKVLASSILFANPQVLAFSAAGGALSWAVMALAWRSRFFSTVAVSVLGGVSHNAGQLLMVAIVLTPQVALAVAPVLAVTGLVTGAAIGVATAAILAALPPEEAHV